MKNNAINFTMLKFGFGIRNFVYSPSNKGFNGLKLFGGYQRVDLWKEIAWKFSNVCFLG
jgi:hypothetical protein